MKVRSNVFAFGCLAVALLANSAFRERDRATAQPSAKSPYMGSADQVHLIPEIEPVAAKDVVRPGHGVNEADMQLRKLMARQLTGSYSPPARQVALFAPVAKRGVTISQWEGTILEATMQADGWTAEVRYSPICDHSVTLCCWSVETLKMSNGVLTRTHFALEGNPDDMIKD